MNFNLRSTLLFLVAAMLLGVVPAFFSPFSGLMIQVAIYGLAVIFLSRWTALGLVVLMAVLARLYADFDMVFVLLNLVWVLTFSWALLDLKLAISMRGLVAPALALVARVGAVVAFESIGIGPIPYSPLDEGVALATGGLAAIFAAAWLGPRLKVLILKEK